MKDLEGRIRVYQSEYESLILETKNLDQEIEELQGNYKIIDNNFDLLSQFKEKILAFQKKSVGIKFLSEFELPPLDAYTLSEVEPLDMEMWSPEKIRDQIQAVMPILGDYGSFTEIEDKYNRQQDELVKISNETEHLLQHSRKWLDILEQQSPDSFFNAILQKNTTLTQEQESILFHLIDMKVSKPEQPRASDRYVADIDILSNDHYEIAPQHHGLWMRLGGMREFVGISETDRLFDDPKKVEFAISDKITVLKKEIKKLDRVKNELQKNQKR